MTYRFGLLAFVTAAAIALAPQAVAQDKSNDLTKDVGNSVENMVNKPLEDMNLKKDEIPAVLLNSMDKPYALDGLKGCKDFQNAIASLSAVLGPDVDTVKAKKGETATEAALGAAESVVGGLIPGTGLIRKLSGAEAAEEKAKAAVLAGSLRRAYLKGTARAKGCKV